jgi:glycosyltransferase involved in cell wall biosynthesis
MKISIIIPVFNVEKYIEKCLESVFKQDVKDSEYEVIIVNDGTLDNSMEIVENFTNEYKNIKIINQNNQGLSSARNAGMKIAQGDYIWFVDSDDWIEENCLQEIIRLLTIYKAEVFVTPLKSVNELNGEINKKSFKGINYISFCTGIDFLKSYEQITPVQIYIFNRLFMKKNNLEFKYGIYHEDLELVPQILYFAKNVCLINNSFYYYLVRNSGSITSSFSYKRSADLVLIIKSLEKFIENNKLSRVEKHYINLRKLGCLYSLLHNFNNTDDYKTRKVFFKKHYLFIKRLSIESILTCYKRYAFYGILLFLNHRLMLFYFKNK